MMSESAGRNVNSAPVQGNLLQAGQINAERFVVNVDAHGRPPVPRMLARDPLHRGFHNRAAELAELDRLLADARARGVPLTVVLSGMPGVGKTMLGLRWAHSVQEGFADGALVVELEATAPNGPASPFDLLGVLLRGLGVDDAALPPSEAERSGLLQTLLERRSVLVLLDDAATSRQVLPLLPSSAASCVVITSRQPLDVGAAEHVSLEPFEPGAALELLSRGLAMSEHDRIALDRLAEACGRLPLALRLAGTRLRGRRSIASFTERVLSRPDLLGQLHDEDDGPLLQLVFDACYEFLPAEQARAYRIAGLHPGPEFSAATAAVLLDVPTPDAEDLLEDLALGHLLEQVGEGRFRMHSLLHRHAAAKSREVDAPEPRAAALMRMADHYHEFAISRDHVLSRRWRLSETRYDRIPPAAGDRLRALRDMDAEHGNLLAAVRAADQLRRPEQVWQLCEALFPYQFDRNLHADLRTVNELGIAAAEELVNAGEPGARAVLARMLAQHASGSFAAHDDAAARTGFERALAVAVECGDARQEHTAVEWLGFLHERAGEPGTALECYDRARRIVLDRFPPERQARPLALHGMHAGRTVVELGRNAEAVALLRPAGEKFHELGERGNVAKCDLPLATAERHLGETVSARKRAERAYESFKELRIHVWRIDALELLARLNEDEGDAQSAAKCLSEAAELAAILGDPRAERLRGDGDR